MMKDRRMRLLGFFLAALLFLPSCRVNYSFTGAALSPDVKTITIPMFPNKAVPVVPTLSRDLTQALRDYFTSQTSLTLVERNGDLTLEGSITGYSVTPVAIQGNETAAMNRLTVTVSVKYTNKKDEKQNFESTFSRYQDYSSSLPLTSVQNDLIDVINRQLVEDIFNKSVASW